MADPAPEATPEAAPPSGKKKVILASGIVSAVIIAECVVAWMLIPSAADVAAANRSRLLAEAEAEAGEAEDGAENPLLKTIELDLGNFSVTSFQPTSNSTFRVEFHLYATVKESESSELEALMTKKEHRLRDQVLFEVRNAQVNDLTDPGLGLIKRRILEKSNELLGKPFLQTVMFSDISVVEQ